MMDTMPLVIPPSTAIMPAMEVEQMRERRELMQALVRDALVQDIDFGIIPGTVKPTLLKSGAEKLCTFFGLSVRLACVDAIEDWTGENHGGDPLFSYRYRVSIYRGDLLVAEAEGSCSSWESRYRWRDSKRVCPKCGQPTILKSKKGGGWYCFSKIGGCGQNFKDGDQAIESQTTGRVANPDIYDLVNTCQKMAQKRAMIAGTLIAVNASDFFTQDLEDAPPPSQSQGAQGVDPKTAEGIKTAVGKLEACKDLDGLAVAAESVALLPQDVRHAPAVRRTYAAMRKKLTPPATVDQATGEVIDAEVTELPSEPSPAQAPAAAPALSAGDRRQIEALRKALAACKSPDQLLTLRTAVAHESQPVKDALKDAYNEAEERLSVPVEPAGGGTAPKHPSHIADDDFPAESLANGAPS